jgi:hypothetical protein
MKMTRAGEAEAAGKLPASHGIDQNPYCLPEVMPHERAHSYSDGFAWRAAEQVHSQKMHLESI